MLEMKNVSFRYDKNSWLVKEASFSIRPGEIVGLEGPSGSGKTTLAKVLAGYIRPNKGEIIVDGQPIASCRFKPVQLIWQNPEKAVNPKWKMKMILQESNGLDEQLFDLFGLKKEWFDRYPSELSGGELQRFCVLRSLSRGTKYIIADEITAMLDAITQAQIWHALLQIAEERKLGLLVISHDNYLLKKLSNRIIDIHHFSK